MVIFFALKSNLLIFIYPLKLSFDKCYHGISSFHPFTLNLLVCLKCFPYRYHIVGSCFFTQSDNLCILFWVFRTLHLTWRMIWLGLSLSSSCYLCFICPIYSLFPLSFFFSLLLDWVFLWFHFIFFCCPTPITFLFCYFSDCFGVYRMCL